MPCLTDISRFFDTQFGFDIESTRGTAVPITEFIPAKTARPTWSRTRIDAQGADGSAQREITDDIGGTEELSASVIFPFRPLSPYEKVLRMIAGGTPVGSALLRYPIANLIPGVSFEIGTGNNFALAAGAIAGSGEFASEVNNPLMCTLNFLAESMTRETSGATAAFDLSRRTFIHQDVILSVDGTDVPISAFKWEWDRNAEVFFANEQQPCALVEKRLDITGEFNLLWSAESEAVFANYITDTTVRIIATYTSGPFILRFTFNDAVLDDVDWPGLDDVDVSEFTATFRANRDDTAGTDAVVIEMSDV